MKLENYPLRALASCILLVAGSCNPVHEERYAWPFLRQGQRVENTSLSTFRIALKQQNLEHAEAYLMNISHPASVHYGKLWSAEEIRNTFSPSTETVERVRSWLATAGIDHAIERGGRISFVSSIGTVEKLLNTEYYEYEDYASETVRIGCERYHLPEYVSKHVDYITPAVALSAPLNKKLQSMCDIDTRSLESRILSSLQSRDLSRPTSDTAQLPHDLRNCGTSMTPSCLRALYGLPNPNELASSYNNTSVNSLGLFEVGGTYNQSDLDLYFSRHAAEIPAGTHPIGDSINGAPVHQGKEKPFSNTETELDLMIAYSLIYPQTVTLYLPAARAKKGSADGTQTFPIAIQELLDALDGSSCDGYFSFPGEDCSIYPPTRVISMSYSTEEIIQPELYLRRQCYEILKVALQGTTFLIATGDAGVSAGFERNRNVKAPTNGCIVVDNYNATKSICYGLNGTVFSSSTPATCPYVLSVGGTQLYPNETILDAESAMHFPHYKGPYTKDDFVFSSSGGFSNYFSRPKYQDAAIETYFSLHDPGYPYYTFNGVQFNRSGNNIGANGGLYNRAGRGLPDVSAIGAHIPTIFNGQNLFQGGSSCATPIWASVITLINEKRSQAGKSPVGFINPVLYEHPEVFHDIVKGNNPGCFTNGFSAVEGWDPITGLGSPNYPKLLELFMSLP